VKAAIVGICTLADYSVGLKNRQHATGNSSFQDRLMQTKIFSVESSSRRKLRKLKTQRLWGDFPTFPRRDKTPDFDIGRKNFEPWKLGKKTG
jgi:hypothetical protein